MKISVVQVIESAAGGAGKHVLGLCRGLPGEGFDVTLVASLRRDPNFRTAMSELEKTGIRCVELDMRRRVSPLRDAVALVRLKKLLAGLRPDVVHGHSSKGGFLARAAARTLGIVNTVYTPHCFAFAGDFGPLKRSLYRRMERIAGCWSARLIAVSSHEAELAASEGILPRERIICIPNGLGEEEFEETTAPSRLPAGLKLEPGRPVLGAGGRLRPQKGIDVLICAFGRVLNSSPGCQLLIIGDGPERGQLEKLARRCGVSEQVVFAGERDDVRELMSIMDVFVLPSRWESAPYSALEAMASATPIVATRVGGVPELLDNGACGELVEPDNPTDLADAIIGLLSDRKRAAELAQSGRRRAQTHYRLSRTISQTAKLYRELAGSKK